MKTLPVLAVACRCEVLLFALLLIGTGCSEHGADVAINQKSRQSGLEQPFTSSVPLEEGPKLAFEAVVQVLLDQQAELMQWDADAGIVSWRAIGNGFSPIPDEIAETGFQEGGRVKLQSWTGNVFGSAQVVGSGAGSVVYFYTRAMISGGTSPVYSSGSYERHLITLVQDKSHKLRLASDTSNNLPPRTPRNIAPAKSLAQLIDDHYMDFPACTTAQIQSSALAVEYSYPPEVVWKVCLDVLCQTGIVVYVDNKERTIASAYWQLAPVDIDKHLDGSPPPTVPVRPLLLAHVASNGTSNSILYIGYFDENMKLKQCRTAISSGSGTSTADLAGMGPLEAGSTIVGAQLFQQIPMQIGYARWGTKLLRRSQ